jgi:3-oxoacyl-[acyl-carrier protein] reductase
MSEPVRTAVVTGGGSGIGAAIADRLASDGLQVAILDVCEDAGRREAARLAAAGHRAIGLRADVTKRSEVVAAFDRVHAELGPVDVLVNNAGISIDRSLRNLTDEEWERSLGVNLTGVMLCSQAATRVMTPRRAGRIVNISSRAWLGWWGQLAYSASKGGVVSATRGLAIELARYGIAVNCVAPGLVDTPLLRREPPEVLERLMAAQPTGEIGQPADVARAVAFFAGMSSNAVTGQVMYVCGGKSLYAQPSTATRRTEKGDQ